MVATRLVHGFGDRPGAVDQAIAQGRQIDPEALIRAIKSDPGRWILGGARFGTCGVDGAGRVAVQWSRLGSVGTGGTGCSRCALSLMIMSKNRSGWSVGLTEVAAVGPFWKEIPWLGPRTTSLGRST